MYSAIKIGTYDVFLHIHPDEGKPDSCDSPEGVCDATDFIVIRIIFFPK